MNPDRTPDSRPSLEGGSDSSAEELRVPGADPGGLGGVGLLFDGTICIACGACSVACKEQNRLPDFVEAHTSAYTWTTLQVTNGAPMRRLCFHCLVPTCVSVCPVTALSRTAQGAVTYDAKKCMGCRYCMMACPFDVPKYQWDRAVPIIGKCILCADRVAQGLPTACAQACPTGATKFGKRADLLREARERMASKPDLKGGSRLLSSVGSVSPSPPSTVSGPSPAPDSYVSHLYGLREAGGTSLLLLSGVPFQQLGLKVNLPEEPPALRTWQVLSNIPSFVAVWGSLLYGIHWITDRREEVKAKEERL